jgi:hypothetical protein
MDLHLRAQLESLAEHLHLHKGSGEERARELEGQVHGALEADDHDGLGDRLSEEAVEFESEHPDLATVLRRVADALSAGGL